jgi:putative ABC transport system permease protein
LDIAHADWNAFALYGIRPLAGSLPGATSDAARGVPGVVVNQAAVRRLGIASNQAALGRTVTDAGALSGKPIMAVVPDFSIFSWVSPANPAVYVPADLSKDGEIVNVKLANRPIPDTLSAIDTVWARTGHTGVPQRGFVADDQGSIFTALALSFGGCALLAVFLACMGLTGLSIAIAERRTKEIGIRKAMGANNGTILAMLLFQSTRPILWASLLGWPAAAWCVHILLATYARHISLQPWAFLASTLIALVLALATTASHAIWAARQKPVLALRYE